VTPTTRREVICDAAIGVIAAEGLRGLTHRAVDRAAGLPEGSTSYYFRTRLALLTGVTERMLALDLADAASTQIMPTSIDAMAELATRIVTHWTGPGRERMLARYEISLEAARNSSLRDHLRQTGAALREAAAAFFATVGATDAARAGRDFVAMLDGLIYDQLVGAGGPRSAADLQVTIRQMLSGLLAPPR
jgi:DNA-binding transcriptional regulator YbjK